MNKILISLSLAFVAIVSCADNPSATADKTAGMTTDSTMAPADNGSLSSDKDQQQSYQISLTHEGDSARIADLLQQGATLQPEDNIPLFFANQFKGLPYVAFTLDQNKEEKLVINTRGRGD